MAPTTSTAVVGQTTSTAATTTTRSTALPATTTSPARRATTSSTAATEFDTLVGGLGADTFILNAALSAIDNIDTVSDFSVADDTFNIDNAVFTGLAAGTLAAAAFYIGAAAHDANDRIIYDSATGALLFDADGTGAGERCSSPPCPPGWQMTNADFVVI